MLGVSLVPSKTALWLVAEKPSAQMLLIHLKAEGEGEGAGGAGGRWGTEAAVAVIPLLGQAQFCGCSGVFPPSTGFAEGYQLKECPSAGPGWATSTSPEWRAGV